ncbi:alpha/beta hydrolase [Rhodopseudomonas palustris]|uniref:Alpha/beta hydrolase n=2 Tax=Rhodopseudomonas palustris TaxID=1076 RepID=A0A323UQ60_RHOPL|nr:alpha/beta hydrolase [Rhodopseudomonas palustris]PZA13810.1 alpha/beta hydrolase [Rhodopseudomonas palustris]
MDVSVSHASHAIYRGMDRTALDAAYNNSAAVGDSPEWLARWRERSAVRRAGPNVRLDIPYAGRERTSLDYFGSGEAGAPLLVFLHGGYWQRNSKEMFSFVAGGPNARGIDVAVVGYTLAPAARLSDIVAEVDQALEYLAGHAERFGFDRDRIVVGGWSAGGHLASVAATRPEVRGALCISGIFDLDPIALCYLNDLLQLDRGEIELLSPIRRAKLGAAPQSLAVGGDELPELRRQSADYADVGRRAGLRVRQRTLPGHHHFSILDELARADGALTAELLTLTRR